MKRASFDGMQLKWIAAACMLLDHSCKLFAPFVQSCLGRFLPPDLAVWGYLLLVGPGRMAFPLVAFFVGEGMRHTRDPKRYLFRLFCFALLSEIPFQLMTCAIQQQPLRLTAAFCNVLVTLLLGGIACLGCSGQEGASRPLSLLPLLFAVCAALLFDAEYGFAGVLMVFCSFYFREQEKRLGSFFLLLAMEYLLWTPAGAGVFRQFSWNGFGRYGFYFLVSLVSLLLLSCYNGGKGKGPRRFFYWFYPLHMLALVGLRMLFLS